MTAKRKLVAIAIILGVCIGCAQTRMVYTPMTHDMVTDAPKWAMMNGKEATTDVVYFVGISQEQVAGESEAINQAYMDAVRRVADALGGLAVQGTDTMNATANVGTRSKWPHQSSARLAVTGVFAGGPGAYALSDGSGGAAAGIAGAGIGYIKKPHYKRDTAAAYCNNRQTDFIREQVVPNITMVDTWAVAERFTRPREAGQVNEMQYGELWKAKALVCIPKKVMDGIAKTQLDMRQRELEQEFEVRKAENELQMEELKTDLELRKRCAQLKLDKPTFHFMNNAYWYGNVPSQDIFQPRAVNAGEFETPNPARILK